jgi:hypothetical protein
MINTNNSNNTTNYTKSNNTDNIISMNSKKNIDIDIVPFNNLNIDKIVSSPPNAKSIPNSGMTYFLIPLGYDYSNNNENPRIDTFYLELPKVKCYNGIIINTPKITNNSNNQQKLDFKPQYQMCISFSTLGYDIKDFVLKFNKLYMKLASIVDANKIFCKLPKFNLRDPESLLKNPLYYQQDPETKEYIPGKSPTLYCKLFKRDFGNSLSEKTLFITPSKKEIDWKNLFNCEIELCPLLSIESIYVGSKASIQMKMVSAIVTNINPRNSVSRQISSLTEILDKDPNIVDKVDEQINKISQERKDFNPESLFVQNINMSPTSKLVKSENDSTNYPPTDNTYTSSGLQNFLQSNSQSQYTSTSTPSMSSYLQNNPKLGIPQDDDYNPNSKKPQRFYQ